MHASPPPEHALAATRAWVERVVIGLDLCPFAAAPARQGRIRYRVSAATTPADLLADLREELALLVDADPAEIGTTLLIAPYTLADFLAYNDFLDEVDATLAELDLDGVVQVASFHPDYTFADAEPDDPADYSNRSPHPMLHLLREDEISRAVDAHPDINGVPTRNVARLRARGLDALRALLAECRAVTEPGR